MSVKPSSKSYDDTITLRTSVRRSLHHREIAYLGILDFAPSGFHDQWLIAIPPYADVDETIAMLLRLVSDAAERHGIALKNLWAEEPESLKSTLMYMTMLGKEDRKITLQPKSLKGKRTIFKSPGDSMLSASFTDLWEQWKEARYGAKETFEYSIADIQEQIFLMLWRRSRRRPASDSKAA